MKTKLWKTGFFVLGTVAVCANLVSANVAVDPAGPNLEPIDNGQLGDVTLGWEFKVEADDIVVTKLGLWLRANETEGFKGGHDIAIWLKSAPQDPLVSTRIGPMAPPTIPWEVGDYLYVDVAKTKLTAGLTYVIGAHWEDDQDKHINSVNLGYGNDAAITVTEDLALRTEGDSLKMPSPGDFIAYYWSANFQFEKDPATMIEALIEAVDTVNARNGILNSLDAKLDAALNALDDTNENNDVAATNALEAFISATQAQSGKQIDEGDATSLIDAAQAIINVLMASS